MGVGWVGGAVVTFTGQVKATYLKLDALEQSLINKRFKGFMGGVRDGFRKLRPANH